MAEFVKLNGYYVKDKKALRYYNSIAEMVADNTLKNDMNVVINEQFYKISNENLTADNRNIIALNNSLFAVLQNDKVDFIYPGKWGQIHSGNSNIVKVANKVILFDTNSADAYNGLISMLNEYNITHLDYVILSHFHSDHTGNFVNLFNDGYIDDTTIVYHGLMSSSFYDVADQNIYNTISNLCNTNNIEFIQPTENQIVNITNNFSLRFGNVNSTYAEANYTGGNQACMVVECNHNNFNALFMGDAVIQAEKYLYNSQFIDKEIQLYNIPHHAIENSCYTQFYDLINPKFAVAQSQMLDYNLNLFTMNQSSALLSEKGCTNYFSFENTNNIHFIESNNNIVCVKGIPTENVGKSFSGLTVYCDSVNFNANIQNGTEEYPFKDLPQALGMMKDYNNRKITIELKPGTYGTAYTGTNTPVKNRANVYNWKNYLEIKGADRETTIINNGVYIANCFKVLISDVTINADAQTNDHAMVSHSNVLFTRCNFIGQEVTPYVGNGIKGALISNIKTSSCKFRYLNNAYYLRGDTVLQTNLDTVNDLTTFLNVDANIKADIGEFNGNSNFSTITNLDNYNSNNYAHVSAKPYKITGNFPMVGEINLPFSMNNLYKKITINYSFYYNGSYSGKSTRTLSSNPDSSILISESNATASGTINVFTLLISLSDKKLTIVRNTISRIASDGTVTMNNTTDPDDTSYGIKINNIILE